METVSLYSWVASASEFSVRVDYDMTEGDAADDDLAGYAALQCPRRLFKVEDATTSLEFPDGMDPHIRLASRIPLENGFTVHALRLRVVQRFNFEAGPELELKFEPGDLGGCARMLQLTRCSTLSLVMSLRDEIRRWVPDGLTHTMRMPWPHVTIRFPDELRLLRLEEDNASVAVMESDTASSDTAVTEPPRNVLIGALERTMHWEDGRWWSLWQDPDTRRLWLFDEHTSDSQMCACLHYEDETWWTVCRDPVTSRYWLYDEYTEEARWADHIASDRDV